MQDESLQYATFLASYDRFKLSLGLNDEQAAERIGVSRQTIWKIQKRRQKLTKKLFFKLQKAEIDAGITPANTTSLSYLNDSNSYTYRNLNPHHSPLKKVKISELERAAAQLRVAIEGIQAGLKGLEKAIERLKEE
ncbi:MAG: hypothetical protein WCS52_02235 [bacterium]